MRTVTEVHAVAAPGYTRRLWVQQASALVTAALLPASATWARSAAPKPPRVLTAWSSVDQFWAGLWTSAINPSAVALPARAHHLLVLPDMTRGSLGQALVVARRPGEFLLRMDLSRGKALQWHRMEVDRYLGGHAVLAADGRTFFTTETDAATGAGLIAERELHSLEKLREFQSGGVGPHALMLDASGNLLVANGGILNLPETGRRKLNTVRMDPNLSRLHVGSGELLSQYRLSDPLLSLRHLAMAPDGSVGVALQAEHPDSQGRQRAPALALLKGEQLQAVPWPAELATAIGWDGYAGDVCHAGGRFWVSAPHAGWLLAWDAHAEMVSKQPLSGVCALASDGSCLLAAGNRDILVQPLADIPSQTQEIKTPWDNHAVLLP